MGTYLYAPDKTPKTISGLKIVQTKCLGKPSYPRNSSWPTLYSPQTEAALNRLHDHFQNIGNPDGFVFGKFCHGAPVLKAPDHIGAGIFDSGKFERIGTIIKVGHTYVMTEVNHNGV